MLKHIVMIRLKEGCDAVRCHALVMECDRHIPDVRRISAGQDIIHLPGSYDYCFILDFNDLEGLKHYDASDYHRLIRDEVRRIRTSSHTVDFIE